MTRLPDLNRPEELDLSFHPMLERVMTAAGFSGPAYAAGNVALFDGLYVSFAGSRQATGVSLTAIRELAGRCTGEGLCVVSGGALGTDSAAHAGALSAGGSTIVLPPCPLQDIRLRTWRRELAALWDAERTLFLSPFPPGTRVDRGTPLRRNRLIAAFADVAVAGETGLTGGTNHFISLCRQARAPLHVLTPGRTNAQLRAALKELERRGATFFSRAECSEPALPKLLADVARDHRRRRDEEDGSQLRFLEEPAEYGAEP